MRSSPSAITSSLASVTITASSTIRCRSTSRPVISRSIHTRRSSALAGASGTAITLPFTRHGDDDDHDMTSVRNVRSTLLSGPRIELRPLRSSDFDDWREVRTRSRDWLEPWEPLADPGSPDPVTDPEAFRARCGAWERQRHFDPAYGFGIFLRRGELVGEVSLGSVQRGPFQSAFVGYWVDEHHAGNGYVPEAVVLTLRYAFDD